ncbi:MAG: peptide chain release factor N(5)-glutamine methyltransferase [Colwellia sp.]
MDKSTTIKQLITSAKIQLESVSDSAKLDAELLLCFVLNESRVYLITWPDKPLSKSIVSQYNTLVNRRAQGEPIAYITGTKEFWSLPFYVAPSTLIPRPDTETLIELVLEEYGEREKVNCLDLGTGTGAIALALASEKPSWNIDAIDFSEEAVGLAKRNAEHLGLAHVNIYHSDWFKSVALERKFDIIVSNPPYIAENDEHISQGDVRFEPLSALIADNDGLADIVHIAKISLDYLTKDGVIFFEHGYNQGGLVRDLLKSFGFNYAKTVKDLNGQDRITWAKR